MAHLSVVIPVLNESTLIKELVLRVKSNVEKITDDFEIILVDDGMATGSTMALAVASIKKLKPKKIIVAVPVASHEAIDHIKELADEVIVPLVPDFFYSVSMWFSDFRQTTDGEVIELLRQANKLKKANNRNGVAI